MQQAQPITVSIVTGLFLSCGGGGGDHPKGAMNAPTGGASTSQVSQQQFSPAEVEAGRFLHKILLDRHSTIDPYYRKPGLSGELTASPLLVIAVPEEDWKSLSPQQQMTLTAYAASFIDAARADPLSYSDTPASAPAAQTIRRNVATMTRQSWGIIVGEISSDGRDIMTDRVVRAP